MPKLLSKVQVLQVYYLISFSYCQCRWLLSFKLPHNGLGLGDSGGLESQNFQLCTNFSNSFFIFTKIRNSLNPPFRQADVRRRFYFLNSYFIQYNMLTRKTVHLMSIIQVLRITSPKKFISLLHMDNIGGLTT